MLKILYKSKFFFALIFLFNNGIALCASNEYFIIPLENSKFDTKHSDRNEISFYLIYEKINGKGQLHYSVLSTLNRLVLSSANSIKIENEFESVHFNYSDGKWLEDGGGERYITKSNGIWSFRKSENEYLEFDSLGRQSNFFNTQDKRISITYEYEDNLLKAIYSSGVLAFSFKWRQGDLYLVENAINNNEIEISKTKNGSILKYSDGSIVNINYNNKKDFSIHQDGVLIFYNNFKQDEKIYHSQLKRKNTNISEFRSSELYSDGSTLLWNHGAVDSEIHFGDSKYIIDKEYITLYKKFLNQKNSYKLKLTNTFPSKEKCPECPLLKEFKFNRLGMIHSEIFTFKEFKEEKIYNYDYEKKSMVDGVRLKLVKDNPVESTYFIIDNKEKMEVGSPFIFTNTNDTRNSIQAIPIAVTGAVRACAASPACVGAVRAAGQMLVDGFVVTWAVLSQYLSDSVNCPEEWNDAREICIGLVDSPQSGTCGGVTGNHTTVAECARGLVSEACGGNKINW